MEILIPSSKRLSFSTPSPPFFANAHLQNLSPAFLSHGTKPLTPKPIVFAKWKRRSSGSRKSHPITLESLVFLASNLRLLPEPLDFAIRESAGGNGGKFGFRNGFGGSGGGGRRGGTKLGFWVILVVSGFLLLCVITLDGGKGSDLTWAMPIFLAMVVYCLGGWWGREIRGWLLGFCCGASMVGLGLQNGNVVRLSQKFRARYFRSCNPIKTILGKTTRRRR